MATKADIIQDDTLYKDLEKLAEKENMELFKISAASGQGVKELMNHVSEILKDLPKDDLNQVDEKVLYTLNKEEDDFEIEVKGREYIVSGPAAERIMRRVNIQDRESMHYLQKCLENTGIFNELREKGIREGDTVKILDWEFEWYN